MDAFGVDTPGKALEVLPFVRRAAGVANPCEWDALLVWPREERLLSFERAREVPKVQA
jgi:hypothetical protein